MSHISYIIFEELSREENHIRGLAHTLKINQMSILRNLKMLEKQNVVDFRTEGRNKTYFIKNTLESKEYVLIVEHDKLLTIIKKYPAIRNIVQHIKDEKEIKLAVLFGSYAKQIPNKDSDIDIYVETNNNKIKEKIRLIDSRLSIKTGIFDKSTALGKEIIRNHVIIKGFERYYELIH